jgi:hypothetical protein
MAAPELSSGVAFTCRSAPRSQAANTFNFQRLRSVSIPGLAMGVVMADPLTWSSGRVVDHLAGLARSTNLKTHL